MESEKRKRFQAAALGVKLIRGKNSFRSHFLPTVVLCMYIRVVHIYTFCRIVRPAFNTIYLGPLQEGKKNIGDIFLIEKIRLEIFKTYVLLVCTVRASKS